MYLTITLSISAIDTTTCSTVLTNDAQTLESITCSGCGERWIFYHIEFVQHWVFDEIRQC